MAPLPTVSVSSSSRRVSRWRLVLALGTGLAVAGCSGSGAVEEVVRPAMVVQIGMGYADTTAFAGEVRARHEPALAFRIPGKIVRRRADVGDAVRKGDVLAELDRADVALQLEAARAQEASAEADRDLARAELDRHRNLFERQLISRSLFETREAAFRAAEARLRQARAQSATSGNQASYAQLRAPSDGVIVQRLAEAGQVVAAGQSVFVLAVAGEREVAISVPEQSSALFTPGKELLVELWAEPGKAIPGRLREISPAADAGSRTYAARVSLGASVVPVELGQSARVYARDAGAVALALPLSALHIKDGQPAVWLVDPATSKIHLTPVKTGAYRETDVPVLSGLKAGDWVVSAGVHLLQEGQTIKPIDRSNRAVALAPDVSAPAQVTTH